MYHKLNLLLLIFRQCTKILNWISISYTCCGCKDDLITFSCSYISQSSMHACVASMITIVTYVTKYRYIVIMCIWSPGCYYYDGKLKIPGYVPYLTFHDAILAQLIVYICMYNSVYKSGSPETISKTINNIKVYNSSSG